MDKYRTDISNLLRLLSFEKRVAFGALICEKLYPNYNHFSDVTSFGNPDILQNAISIIFQSIYRNDLFSDEDLQNVIDEIESITPNTEDFDTILVSFALDACTSILSTLYFIQNGEVENIIDAATYARDTVDMYIQERDNLMINDNLLEEKIENDILMRREKKRQKDVIWNLQKIGTLNDNALQELRNLQPLPIID